MPVKLPESQGSRRGSLCRAPRAAHRCLLRRLHDRRVGAPDDAPRTACIAGPLGLGLRHALGCLPPRAGVPKGPAGVALYSMALRIGAALSGHHDRRVGAPSVPPMVPSERLFGHRQELGCRDPVSVIGCRIGDTRTDKAAARGAQTRRERRHLLKPTRSRDVRCARPKAPSQSPRTRTSTPRPSPLPSGPSLTGAPKQHRRTRKAAEGNAR